MLTCASCGRENPAASRFCNACGATLASADGGPREERKVVTVLFCDLVGFTQRSEEIDPEDVRALLRRYHGHLRGELERFGGAVEKFIGDAVVAVFGAPAAHEDDPERAVRAALAIREWAGAEEGLKLRIAVNTGEALVTLGTRPEQGEGMVAGETTYRATRDRIEYREAERVEAKGKAEPVRVWEALEARSRLGVDVVQRVRSELVGRDGELHALSSALARVKERREPQLLTIVGVPGIGKSRLVYELFRQVEEQPELVRWRQGRSLPYGERVAFWALAEMVKGQAGILESDSREQVERKLHEAVSTLLPAEEGEWVERHLR